MILVIAIHLTLMYLAKKQGMKRNRRFYHKMMLGIGIISQLVTMQACSLENFSKPLPVDKPNSYLFPEVMLGKWIGEDSEIVGIEKKYFSYVNMAEQDISVVKGIWPRKDDSGRYVYPPKGYEAVGYQHFDSLQNATDTDMHYIVSKNYIYRMNGKGRLSLGYHYRTKEDTFFVQQKDTVWFDMGRNMFIRDMGKGLFALNINNSILGQDTRWWQLALLQVINKDTISYWGVSDKMKGLPEFLHSFEEKYYSAIYFECNFTSAEIRNLMREGYFEHKGFLSRSTTSKK